MGQGRISDTLYQRSGKSDWDDTDLRQNRKHMPRKIFVVAAVIERDGSYLICQRPLRKRYGGLWEFPGGKLLDGENTVEAATRELAEELSIEVQSVREPLLSLEDPGSNFVIMFCSVEAVGEPTANEHLDVRWVGPGELLDFDLAPSDQQFARVLTDGWKREP